VTENPGKNPMNAAIRSRNLALAHASPRCGARTRAGLPCKAQAMRNGRCYRHGGPSTGPRTPEGLQRIVAARTVHGRYGAAMRELRRLMRLLDDEQRRVLELVK
jgi:hypothetical protein